MVLLNPAILVGSYGMMRLLGRPLPEPHVPLAAAPLLLLVFLPPAVGEEAGWMAYAADPLQERWRPQGRPPASNLPATKPRIA